MKPLPHEYGVELVAGSDEYATVAGPGLPCLTVAPPREYDGPGDAWSPEHLLLAAVTACFLFTFRAIAKASHVEFLEVTAHTSGTVDRSDGTTRFTAIGVCATVTAAAGANLEALQRVVDRTGARCLVSSSLSAPVKVEATIRSTATPAAA